MTEQERPLSLFRKLVDNVVSSQAGRELLEDNPIDQVFVFEATDGDSFMMEVKRGTSDIKIAEGSRPYRYPEVLLCKGTTKTLANLFSGRLRVGRAYVDNMIELRGELLAKALLGNLVRVNQEVLHQFIPDTFKYAP